MIRTVAVAIALAILSVSAPAAGTESIRKPAVAGTFYPADSGDLANIVSEHLKAAPRPEIDGQIIALIVPHAGLVYSGAIAAHAYRLLENTDVETIILCGPSHRHRFSGASVFGPGVTWETPLGPVPPDQERARRLVDHDRRINVVPRAHTAEHSLEVQLPYIQTVLPEAGIVPVTMGSGDGSLVQATAEALAAASSPGKTILVASTDWQHYRPASVGAPMDSLGMNCLEDLDPDRLQRYLTEGKVEACGGAPTVAVIKAALDLGANRAKILRYGDSGDITGDKSSVVGYVAAVLYRSPPEPLDSEGQEESKMNAPTGSGDAKYLSESEKQRLLSIARSSIKTYLETGRLPDYDVSGTLARPGAAFVTLEKDGLLRGCIGRTRAAEPLYQTVSQCAVQSAVADQRFYPVTKQELPTLDISISVLTPLQKVSSLDDIKVGRDGLMIEMDGRRGLLLPQVATEYGWNREEFLQQTCVKAGLPTDSYRSGRATIYRFQALVFGEKETSHR